jgi:hypothetical protein
MRIVGWVIPVIVPLDSIINHILVIGILDVLFSSKLLHTRNVKFQHFSFSIYLGCIPLQYLIPVGLFEPT